MCASKRKELVTKNIETERLILRKFTIDDIDDLYEWASDKEATKFMLWKTHENKEETKAILNDWIKHYEGNDFANWCIELKETKEAIGSIGALNEVEENEEFISTGYIIKRKYWGRGIASEAHKAVCDYLLNELNVQCIVSYCNVNNAGSRRVLEKAGFVFEKRGQRETWNGPVDYFFFKLTRKI